ncbi:MAG TPA: hypothetical protein VFU59_12270 [Candidatus Eisenbacteria bacterium]|nr:hypothetical protein [Candidatus Eisenbacteria bacterium]
MNRSMNRNVIRWMMMLTLCGAFLAAPSRDAVASIPDADVRAGSNEGGFGAFDGVFGRADFGFSERSAVGAYVGVDPHDIYFSDYGVGDRRFDDDMVVGGHYMYQFVEGVDGNPNVAMIAGAFANRAGLRPELGLALSYPFADRWVGRLNAVYGPSWGLEFGYNFTPTVQGTFGVTGMGLVGIGFRF